MFYVLAILVVAAALFAVLVPSTRLLLIGVAATDVLVGILVVAAGAVLLGVVVIVAPPLCLLGSAALLQRGGVAALLADLPGPARAWPWVAAVSAGLGALLVWTAASSADNSGRGSGPTAALVTILHYRTPVSLGVAVLLAVVSVTGALLIGRTGDDEHRLDRAAEQRRLREQRAAARRDQRAAARAQGRRGQARR